MPVYVSVFGAEYLVTFVGLYDSLSLLLRQHSWDHRVAPWEPHPLPDSIPLIQPLFYNFAITPLYADPRPGALACWDVSPAADCSHG